MRGYVQRTDVGFVDCISCRCQEKPGVQVQVQVQAEAVHAAHAPSQGEPRSMIYLRNHQHFILRPLPTHPRLLLHRYCDQETIFTTSLHFPMMPRNESHAGEPTRHTRLAFVSARFTALDYISGIALLLARLTNACVVCAHAARRVSEWQSSSVVESGRRCTGHERQRSEIRRSDWALDDDERTLQWISIWRVVFRW